MDVNLDILSVVLRADVCGTEGWRRTRCGSAPQDGYGSSRSSRGQSLRIYLPRFPHSHPTNSPVLSALPSPTAPSTGLSILKSPSMKLLFFKLPQCLSCLCFVSRPNPSHRLYSLHFSTTGPFRYLSRMKAPEWTQMMFSFLKQ